jgi:hypothetical protein
MFELLPECQRIARAGLDAKAAEGAHGKMIDVPIDDAKLFPFGRFDPFRDNLDRTVGTVGFTDPATGAAMLVVWIVRHDDLSLEPVEHPELPAVLRILLGDDLPGIEKIFPGYGHPNKQGFHAMKDIGKIFEETVHSFRNANPLILRMP